MALRKTSIRVLGMLQHSKKAPKTRVEDWAHVAVRKYKQGATARHIAAYLGVPLDDVKRVVGRLDRPAPSKASIERQPAETKAQRKKERRRKAKRAMRAGAKK